MNKDQVKGTDAQVAEQWRKRALTAEGRVGELERRLRSAREDLLTANFPAAAMRITKVLRDDT